MPPLSKSTFAMLLSVALVSAPMLPVTAAETYVAPSMSQPAVQPLYPAGSSVSRQPVVQPHSATSPVSGQPAVTQAEPLQPAAAPPPPEPEISAMERFFAQAPGLENANLRQFGYDTFRGELVGGNLTSESGIPGTYPLGPGDELILNAPLSTEELRAAVDRNGKIFLPGRGLISVAGMTLDQFQTMMRGSKGSQVSVRLGRLRSMTVYLSGRVASPGSYTVNALSTVTTLLQMAGGVSKNGSLRQVQLRRGGKTVASFDLYDFLLKGTNSGNLRLEAGDIIFVPNIGPQVAIAGSVRQPAIYEIKPGTTAAEAIALAGGLLAQAFTQQVQVQRVAASTGREMKTLDFTQAAAQATKVQDGDLIRIPGVLNRISNGVTLSGNVERPGWYEIKAGTRVSEILGSASALKRESYFDFAQIEREVGEDRHIEIIPFNLGKALQKDSKEDLVLHARDTITVFSLNEFQNAPEVEIYGAVMRPGKYRLYPNMRLAELISVAGGMLPEADPQSGELTRTEVIESSVKHSRKPFAPANALKGGETENWLLADHDVVQIHTVPDYHRAWTVQISGEVMRPGTYSIIEGETLSQVMERAGGFTARAFPNGAYFTRQAVKILQQQQMQTLADRIEQSLTSLQFKSDSNEKQASSVAAQQEIVKRLRSTEATGRIVVALDHPNRMRQHGQDIALSHGDKLHVPPRNETVSVLGAIYAPNALRHDGGMTVSDYLNAAGGATPVGDMGNVYVIRADGQVHALSNYREGWWIFSRNLMASKLNPGDTIIVPERVEWVDHWGGFLKSSAAVAQILTSGALMYNAFK